MAVRKKSKPKVNASKSMSQDSGTTAPSQAQYKNLSGLDTNDINQNAKANMKAEMTEQIELKYLLSMCGENKILKLVKGLQYSDAIVQMGSRYQADLVSEMYTGGKWAGQREQDEMSIELLTVQVGQKDEGIKQLQQNVQNDEICAQNSKKTTEQMSTGFKRYHPDDRDSDGGRTQMSEKTEIEEDLQHTTSIFTAKSSLNRDKIRTSESGWVFKGLDFTEQYSSGHKNQGKQQLNSLSRQQPRKRIKPNKSQNQSQDKAKCQGKGQDSLLLKTEFLQQPQSLQLPSKTLSTESTESTTLLKQNSPTIVTRTPIMISDRSASDVFRLQNVAKNGQDCKSEEEQEANENKKNNKNDNATTDQGSIIQIKQQQWKQQKLKTCKQQDSTSKTEYDTDDDGNCLQKSHFRHNCKLQQKRKDDDNDRMDRRTDRMDRRYRRGHKRRRDHFYKRRRDGKSRNIYDKDRRYRDHYNEHGREDYRYQKDEKYLHHRKEDSGRYHCRKDPTRDGTFRKGSFRTNNSIGSNSSKNSRNLQQNPNLQQNQQQQDSLFHLSLMNPQKRSINIQKSQNSQQKQQKSQQLFQHIKQQPEQNNHQIKECSQSLQSLPATPTSLSKQSLDESHMMTTKMTSNVNTIIITTTKSPTYSGDY